MNQLNLLPDKTRLLSLEGVSDAPASSTPAPVKPTGAQDQKVPGAIAKAASSNVHTGAQPANISSMSGSTAPTTPAKGRHVTGHIFFYAQC